MAKNNKQQVNWTDKNRKGSYCVCESSWRCRCRAQITGR